MKTIIVTGLSGAGKSQAIQILEDLGYFCVDNLPPQLIRTFVDLCQNTGAEIDRLALVTDIRSDIFSEKFQSSLISFLQENRDIEMLFLEADDETLVTRYQESRRKHPLTGVAGSLSQSIKLEREKMAAFREEASYVIDTTGLSTKELRATLKQILSAKDGVVMTQINISSFGFKYGLPRSADYVFDVRFLPNPFYKKELRGKTGEDAEVRDYVMSFPEAQEFYKKILELVAFVIPQFKNVEKDHLEIAFGCTGGQHRSVTFAYLVEEAFRKQGYVTRVIHRDITKDREAK
ncbi:MAG: RNase adapter RapZ [Eubacterium sp.]|nr:RNase adapter RapZ [Eubacterium sp.]